MQPDSQVLVGLGILVVLGLWGLGIVIYRKGFRRGLRVGYADGFQKGATSAALAHPPTTTRN